VRTKPFDEPLERSLLDIDQRTRANLFAWRGQFSPQFAEAILTHYGCEADVVLDPFAGSGTVLVEAARLGRAVHGVELNPAAAALARVYEMCRHSPAEREHALGATRKQLEHCTHSDAAELGRALARAARSSSTCAEGALLDALVVQLDGSPRGARRLEALFAALAARVRELPRSQRSVVVSLGDARHLPDPDGSVDFVLTSPPYINVFNYHHNYRSGVEALGWLPLVAARSEIGANRKFRQNRFLTVV
jgi:16S rRNA G966 N2-methylase RsmD